MVFIVYEGVYRVAQSVYGVDPFTATKRTRVRVVTRHEPRVGAVAPQVVEVGAR